MSAAKENVHDRRTGEARPPLRWVGWLLAILAASIVPILWRRPSHPFEDLRSYAALHMLLEAFAVAVSAAVFAVGWNAGSRAHGKTHVPLGTAFLAVAVLDSLHSLSTAGMPVLVTPSGPEKAIGFWLAARFAAAIAMLVTVLRVGQGATPGATAWRWFAGALGYAALVAWVILFHPGWLPRTFIPGQGLTGVKIAAEWVLIALSGAAALIAFRRAGRADLPYDAAGLCAAAGVTVLSEVCFAVYANTTDIFNFVGHLYKIIAYGLLYRGVVVVGVRAPYLRLQKSEEEIRALNADLERRVAERTADLEVANAELTRALATKDEFLAAMSHELRTPLNAVLGLSEAMEEGVYGPLRASQRGALRRVDESGRHLLALIDDILDLSRVGAGKLVLERAPVALDDLCRASGRIVQESAARKRQRLTVAVEEGDTVIHADERRLRQVLVNLLDNAVKFTPEGGEIGIDAAPVAGGERVRITVWDTGMGIAPEDRARIFQPFVQLDAKLSRSHGGAGLGLALVKQLVELSDGALSLESALGKGSRFTVEIPVGRPPEPREQPALGPREALRIEPTGSAEHPRGRVLVVDDDEVNVATIADFLRSRGHEVLAAHDGRDAVAQARASQPDVILMDIQMPQVDGLAAMREIRGSDQLALRRVPIVALTALAMAGDRERCLAAGADEYLAKPVALRALGRTVEALLAQPRSSS